jgi:hypothetical protein
MMSVAFVSPQSGWAVGRDGVILHTDDSGATWKFQTSGTGEDLDEVNFVSPQSGWAVGHAGIILHTQDGGSTWSQEKSGTNVDLMSVCVVKPYGVIGLQLEDVTSGTGAQAHVVMPGSKIGAVVQGGPADSAGLKVGDIIVSLNGNPMKNTADLVSSIFVLRPGSDAKLVYIRNGQLETIDVIVGDGSKPFPSAARH